MRPDRSITALIVALAGLMACGVHFALMYAIATLACLRPQSTDPTFDFRSASIAVTAILLSGLVAYLVHRIRTASPYDPQSQNDSRNFLDAVAIALGLLAIVTVIWVTLPAFMIVDCRA